MSSLNQMRIVKADEFHSGSGIEDLSVVVLEAGTDPRVDVGGQCALA